MVQERDVIALHVTHLAAHSREARAEAQVVGGIVLGRFTLRPIPLPAILNVHDVNSMVMNGRTPALEAQVIDAAQAFFEDLRGHDGGADRKRDSAVQLLDGAAKEGKVLRRSATNRGSAEH